MSEEQSEELKRVQNQLRGERTQDLGSSIPFISAENPPQTSAVESPVVQEPKKKRRKKKKKKKRVKEKKSFTWEGLKRSCVRSNSTCLGITERDLILRAVKHYGSVIFLRSKIPVALFRVEGEICECIVLECGGVPERGKDRCWACEKIRMKCLQAKEDEIATTTLNVLPQALKDRLTGQSENRSDRDELVQKIQNCLNSGSLVVGKFQYEYMLHVTNCLQAKSLRALRYPLSIITLSISLMWFAGKRGLQLMRGKGGLGSGTPHGALKLDSNKINFFLPAPSTLRKYLPVRVDVTIEEMARAEASKFCAGYQGRLATDANTGENFIPVLLCSDGIAVRPGVQRLRKSDKILGLIPHEGSDTGTLSVSGLAEWMKKHSVSGLAEWMKKHTDLDIEQLLAKNALTTLMVDIHGKTLNVISQIPVATADWKIHLNLYQRLRSVLEEFSIRIVATSTDCFAGAAQFVDQETKDKDLAHVVHIFDSTHTSKNTRNYMKDKTVKTEECEEGFGLHVLHDFWAQGTPLAKDLRDLIAYSDLYPSDIMDIDPLKHLFLAIDEIRRVGQVLQASIVDENRPIGEKLVAMSIYLSHVRTWYQIWQDYPDVVELSMQEKLRRLEEVVTFFETIRNTFPRNSCTKETVFQLRTTLDSLRDLNAKYREWFGCDLPKLGHLGTNALENLFSIVRGKEHYCTYLSVRYLTDRSTIEMHKRCCPVLPWSYLFGRLGTKYGDYSSLALSWSDVCSDLITPRKYKELAKTRRLAYREASREDRSAVKTLELRFKARRQILTLRLRLCRADPLNPVPDHTSKVSWSCPLQKACTHPSPYVKKGCLLNHLQGCHGLEKKKAKDVLRTVVPSNIKIELQVHNLRPTPEREDDICWENPATVDTGTVEISQSPVGGAVDIPPSQVGLFLLDTETTGFGHPQDIIQIAVRDMLSGDVYTTFITTNKTAYQMRHATALHGITRDFLDSRGIPYVAAFTELFTWIRSHTTDHCIFVAHNAPFDRSQFDENNARRLLPESLLDLPSIHWVCSLQLIKDREPDLGEYSLEFLAQHYEVAVPGEAHDARVDVLTLLQVLRRVYNTDGNSDEAVIQALLDAPRLGKSASAVERLHTK